MLLIFARGGRINLYGLDEAWADLISSAKKLGLEGSASFIALIKKMREAGLESQALNAYMQEQLDRIPKALVSLIDAVEETGGSLTELGSLTLHTFNAMLGSGVSFTEAVTKMQEPLAALKAKYAEWGLAADPALQRLFHIVEITEAHKELFTAVEANREILEALGNSGWLTADAMEALTKNAVSYYNQLQTSGLTADEALRAMAPTLQKIYDYAKSYGIELDEATLSLIDNAKEAGYVKEAQQDTATILSDIKTILNDIKDILGGGLKKEAGGVKDVFGDWEGEIDKARDAADELAKSTKKIGGKFNFEFEPEDIPSYQHGGIARRPHLAQVGDVPEAIIPLKDLQVGSHSVAKPIANHFYIYAVDAKSFDDYLRSHGKDAIVDVVQGGLDHYKLRIPTGTVRG
jgi:hypothetical protein